MRIHKFESVDAFVALDLDDAESASGPVRWARKVLQGGAKDLARSQTYTYASLGMRRGGASAGISAEAPDRAGAVAAFVTEMAPLVADQTYLADPAKGVSEADLAPLRPDDPRDTQRLGVFAARCNGLSAAVVAQHTVGGLDGCRIVVEGFGPSGPALAEAVVERGGSVVAVSTSAGAAASTNGLDVSAITEAWSEHREALVEHIGEPIDEPVLSIGSEVIFAGSGMGVIGHQAAADLGHARAVVPCGRLPLTARGLAVLRSMGVPAPADFLALAGSTLALWGDPNRTDAEILAGITEDVADLSAEFARHPDGPLLAACYEAESFLGTWRDTLPFGRPLAP